jgi:hypothetical protein
MKLNSQTTKCWMMKLKKNQFKIWMCWKRNLKFETFWDEIENAENDANTSRTYFFDFFWYVENI